MRTKIISVDMSEDIVGTDEAMQHSRIEDDYDIELVQIQVAAATDLVSKWLNRKLFPTDMVGSIPTYRKKINLPYPPIHSVSKVTIEDDDGNEMTLTEGVDYVFDDISEQVIFRVIPPQNTRNNVKVHFSCGYQTAEEVPQAIRHAIKQTFATLYENREDTVIGASVNEVPLKTQRLIGAYRIKAIS